MLLLANTIPSYCDPAYENVLYDHHMSIIVCVHSQGLGDAVVRQHVRTSRTAERLFCHQVTFSFESNVIDANIAGLSTGKIKGEKYRSLPKNGKKGHVKHGSSSQLPSSPWRKDNSIRYDVVHNCRGSRWNEFSI